MLFTLYLIKLNWMFAWHLPLCTRLYSDGRKQIEKPWKFREQRLTNWLDLGTSASPDPAFLLWNFGDGFVLSSPQHLFWFEWEISANFCSSPSQKWSSPWIQNMCSDLRSWVFHNLPNVCQWPKESFLPEVSQQLIFLFYLQECLCLHCFPQQDCLPVN